MKLFDEFAFGVKKDLKSKDYSSSCPLMRGGPVQNLLCGNDGYLFLIQKNTLLYEDPCKNIWVTDWCLNNILFISVPNIDSVTPLNG